MKIQGGMYQLRLRWTTRDDELEVAYINVTVSNYESLKYEIEYAKKKIAYTAKSKDDIIVTYSLVKLSDATLSYDEYDDYLNLRDDSEDIKFILNI